MTERPILMSAPMVRAILAGTKTQTRRAVKPQPERDRNGVLMWRAGKYSGFGVDGVDVPQMLLERCPYGAPGDRLWVRETWAAPHNTDHLKPSEIDGDWRIHYAATEDLGGLLKRPSIFMPRWASRITLEVTSVRVERLQDISEADAEAEGVQAWADTACARGNPYNLDAIGYFDLLWASINGRASWDANHWVWVIEFRRIAPDGGERGA